MDLITMVTAILGLLTAALSFMKAAIELLTRARKGQSRVNRRE